MSRAPDPLVFDRLSFTYPEAERPALDDVSLTVPAGAFALVAGRTGAGKSTLLRCANGLVPHFTGGTFGGRVYVEGRDTTQEAPRNLADIVAFVPQDPGASFVLDRVEDELAYGMENLAVPPQQMRRRVEEVLDLLAIESLRRRSVRTLSGGERQRVAIAAALAAGPRVLALDEPTSQLDPQGAEDVLAALQRLVHDHGMTVLIAEHRLERVAGFVDLAIGIEDGGAIIGSPHEVLDQLQIGPPVARLGRRLGWTPTPLTVRDARRRADDLTLPEPQPLHASSTTAEPLLEAKGLKTSYGDEVVLRGVDWSIAAGDVVALMGRNGAGKTTLLRSLAGLQDLDRGSVRMSTTNEPPRAGIDVAVCPQHPEDILFKDTVADEVIATLRARELQRDPSDVLRIVGIEDLADRHPRELSDGQRLLVAIAAVIAAEPEVLMLDEPTRGLDPDAKRRLTAFLDAYAEEGRAVICATHDVELAADVATRVAMLARGELIADGEPGPVLGDSHVFAPQMTRVFGMGWLTPDQVEAAVMPA